MAGHKPILLYTVDGGIAYLNVTSHQRSFKTSLEWFQWCSHKKTHTKHSWLQAPSMFKAPLFGYGLSSVTVNSGGQLSHVPVAWNAHQDSIFQRVLQHLLVIVAGKYCLALQGVH